MTEPATIYEVSTPKRTDMPYPFCGGRNLSTGTWAIGPDDAHKHLSTNELGELDSIECEDCLGSAPAEIWNTRADQDLIVPTDMWRYPPDMPENGQRIVKVYLDKDGNESLPITTVWFSPPKFALQPMVRWFPIPEVK